MIPKLSVNVLIDICSSGSLINPKRTFKQSTNEAIYILLLNIFTDKEMYKVDLFKFNLKYKAPLQIDLPNQIKPQ